MREWCCSKRLLHRSRSRAYAAYAQAHGTRAAAGAGERACALQRGVMKVRGMLEPPALAGGEQQEQNKTLRKLCATPLSAPPDLDLRTRTLRACAQQLDNYLAAALCFPDASCTPGIPGHAHAGVSRPCPHAHWVHCQCMPMPQRVRQESEPGKPRTNMLNHRLAPPIASARRRPRRPARGGAVERRAGVRRPASLSTAAECISPFLSIRRNRASVFCVSALSSAWALLSV